MKGSQPFHDADEALPPILLWLSRNSLFSLILNWLDLVHLGLLDIAVANPRERTIWTACLHQVDSEFFDHWQHSHNSVRWALKRNLCLTNIQIDARHE
jgi:hypothetical protein